MPKRWLHDLLQHNDNMRAAAVEMQSSDLWKARRKLAEEVNIANNEIQTLKEDLANLNTKLSNVAQQSSTKMQ